MELENAAEDEALTILRHQYDYVPIKFNLKREFQSSSSEVWISYPDSPKQRSEISSEFTLLYWAARHRKLTRNSSI